MANSYDRGDTVRCAATFVASVAPFQVFDPASVYVLLRNPLGSIATYGYPASVTKAGVGAYYVDVVPSTNPAKGVWTYRFDSAAGAAGEGSFNVRATPFL